MIDKELLKILERKAEEFQYEFDENVLSPAWNAHKQFLKRYPFRTLLSILIEHASEHH